MERRYLKQAARVLVLIFGIMMVHHYSSFFTKSAFIQNETYVLELLKKLHGKVKNMFGIEEKINVAIDEKVAQASPEEDFDNQNQKDSEVQDDDQEATENDDGELDTENGKEIEDNDEDYIDSDEDNE